MFSKSRICSGSCVVKIKVGRQRAKEQMKTEGNKTLIMKMRKLPRQE